MYNITLRKEETAGGVIYCYRLFVEDDYVGSLYPMEDCKIELDGTQLFFSNVAFVSSVAKVKKGGE